MKRKSQMRVAIFTNEIMLTSAISVMLSRLLKTQFDQPWPGVEDE